MALRQNQQWISLETLTPDTLYEFQVRVRAQRGSHKTWSPWSQPLAFRTRPAGTSGQKGWDRAQVGGGGWGVTWGSWWGRPEGGGYRAHLLLLAHSM